jgi:hypothetical protein
VVLEESSDETDQDRCAAIVEADNPQRPYQPKPERALVMPEPWMAQPSSRVSKGCPIDIPVLIGIHGD